MNTVLNNDEVVLKVFNNNIVLVNYSGKEKILFAKGIGFGKKPNAIIPKGTEIQKIFSIEDEENIDNFHKIIKKIDNEFIAVCEEAIYIVSNELDCELNERIHIGLIDHLFVAAERLKNGKEIENPFLIETQTLYPREYELSQIIANHVGNYSKVKFSEGEVGFITLHIHSAINDGKISNTMKNTYLNKIIVEILENEFNLKVDRKSLDYARFSSHIKFAIQRILNKISVKNDLAGTIKETYKDSYEAAKRISHVISKELKAEVSEEEIAFLTIHIERFKNRK